MSAWIVDYFGPMKFLFFLLFTFRSWAGDAGCMTRHLEDALKINQERLSIYGRVQEGISIPVSKALIDFEKKMLPQAKWADWLALPLQNQGIPVLCNDLKDMSEAPSLAKSLPTPTAPVETDFVFLNITQMQIDLSNALEVGPEQVEKRGLYYLSQLEDEPRLNCLLRHFLESIVVFARHTTKYKKQLDGKPFWRTGLSLYMKQVMRQHINYLVTSDLIDRSAVRAQTEGIPVLCDDVPQLLENFSHPSGL